MSAETEARPVTLEWEIRYTPTPGGMQQPYAVWYGGQVWWFARTRIEAEAYVRERRR